TYSGNAVLDNLTSAGVYTASSAGGHTITFVASIANPYDNTKTVSALIRDDGSSWLDSGFLEGQLITLNGDPNTNYKIEAFDSTGGGNLNRMYLTTTVATNPGTTPTVLEVAPVITFNPSNWHQAVTVPLP